MLNKIGYTRIYYYLELRNILCTIKPKTINIIPKIKFCGLIILNRRSIKINATNCRVPITNKNPDNIPCQDIFFMLVYQFYPTATNKRTYFKKLIVLIYLAWNNVRILYIAKHNRYFSVFCFGITFLKYICFTS